MAHGTVGFLRTRRSASAARPARSRARNGTSCPGHEPQFRDSFDNTGQLDEQNWRYVQFQERSTPAGGGVIPAAAMVLVGGLALRIVVVFAPQAHA